MDNAGGGTRGLKPTVTPSVIDAVQRTWALDLDTAVVLGGSTGLNLLVNDGKRRAVVRVHRSHVTAARVRALQAARRAAALGGIPTAVPILGRHGASIALADSCVIEAEAFVDSDAKMDALPRIHQAMPVLAHMHNALEPAQLPAAADDLRFANYVAAHEIATRVGAGIARIRKLDASLHPIADMANAVLDGVAATPTGAARLRGQWCHGDYWDNNVLFRDGQIVLVTDFGFMNRRPRIDDLALTLYFTLWQLEAAGQPDPAIQLAELVNAYDSGTTRRLTNHERSALPIALARQALWSIGAWAVGLDDDATLIAHLQGHETALSCALDILDHIDYWQEAFERP